VNPHNLPPGATVEILLVEDNPGDVRLIQEAFKESGVPGRLHIARDGEQALAFLHHEGPFRDSPRPLFILLDLNLPRKDGCEVLAEIKSTAGLRKIPVLILSTSTRTEDIVKAYDLHANCYIPKPADLDSLVEFSRQLKAFWLCMAVLPV
jgi:two-component system, chemotaxis family, response regulator Rcp1